jgi:glycosyltransferase involved in cell wall biosynthesis
MNLRIGLDYTAGINQGAGIGRYTRSLVRALAEIDAENRYVLFYAAEEGGDPRWSSELAELLATHSNFSAVRAPLPARAMTIAWHRLHLPWPVDRMIGRVDVFHSPDFVAVPQLRGRSIVTVHDLSYLTTPECADPSLRAYLKRAVWQSVRKADAVVAVSENTRRDLARLLRLPENRLRVVPNGIDEQFRPVGDESAITAIRQKIGVEEPFILSVGTLEPRKNLVRLLEAFSGLAGQGLEHKLVLAGRKGWLYQPILEAAAPLQRAGRVVLVDFVGDDNLPALYSAAEAFVYPSLYEGFGLPPLEAMACGTPVVASNTSSLPEVLGEAALLVEPHDVAAIASSMRQVLTDADLRARLIAAGLEQARRFTWRVAAERLIGLYRGEYAGS